MYFYFLCVFYEVTNIETAYSFMQADFVTIQVFLPAYKCQRFNLGNKEENNNARSSHETSNINITSQYQIQNKEIQSIHY